MVAPPVEGKREKDLGKIIGRFICLFKEAVTVLKHFVFMSLYQPQS